MAAASSAPALQVGVIDAVCMTHPSGHAVRQGKTSLYNTIPKDRWARLGYEGLGASGAEI